MPVACRRSGCAPLIAGGLIRHTKACAWDSWSERDRQGAGRIRCRTCDSPPGDPCVQTRGRGRVGPWRRSPHASRVAEAARPASEDTHAPGVFGVWLWRAPRPEDATRDALRRAPRFPPGPGWVLVDVASYGPEPGPLAPVWARFEREAAVQDVAESVRVVMVGRGDRVVVAPWADRGALDAQEAARARRSGGRAA